MDDKFMDIIASAGIGVSVTQLPIYFIVGNANIPLYLLATVVSGLISSPIIYHTTRKIRNKHAEEDRKRANCVRQTLKGLYELEKDGKMKVNQETSIFYKKITNILAQESIELDASEVNTINDLIHLINANYYYEITKKNKLEREDIIERILIQVAMYLKENNKRTIGDKDIDMIVNNCFFIKENIKNDIVTEFKNSAVKFGSSIQHSVENRYIDSEEHKEESKNQKSSFVFDVDDIEHYKILVEGLTAKDTYLREYGNIDNIEWDYQVLKDVFSIMINKFKPELKKIEFEDGYSEFNLARSYFYNIMCYAVMNQKAVVDYQSILATFKDWDYLPYKIKLEMATEIIRELDLKDIKHPYLQKMKPKEKKKIVKFPGNN